MSRQRQGKRERHVVRAKASRTKLAKSAMSLKLRVMLTKEWREKGIAKGGVRTGIPRLDGRAALQSAMG